MQVVRTLPDWVSHAHSDMQPPFLFRTRILPLHQPTPSTSSEAITLPKHLLTPLATLADEYGNRDLCSIHAQQTLEKSTSSTRCQYSVTKGGRNNKATASAHLGVMPKLLKQLVKQLLEMIHTQNDQKQQCLPHEKKQLCFQPARVQNSPITLRVWLIL